MGIWSGEPFGNDVAADWAWELDESETWDLVLDALTEVVDEDPATVDQDDATIAIAAAEVVAHAVRKATQSDAYTESVTVFVGRIGDPPEGIAALALRAIDVAASADGELAALWSEGSNEEWRLAIARLRESLSTAR